MFFERLTDKIVIFNLFGKTTVHLNVTIQEEHDNISQPIDGPVSCPPVTYIEQPTKSSNVVPAANVAKDKESHNNCPICHKSPCTCEASGDGNFVM